MCSLSHLLSGPPWLPLSPALTTGHWVLCLSCCPAEALLQRLGQRGRGARHPAGPHLQWGALVFVSCSLARTPQMSGVARLFPCPSSLHGRVQPGLAPSPLGGRRAPPELGPLPSCGADPSLAASTRPYLVNRGRPGPSAAGAAPQCPESLTDGDGPPSLVQLQCHQVPAAVLTGFLRVGPGPMGTSRSQPGHPYSGPGGPGHSGSWPPGLRANAQLHQACCEHKAPSAPCPLAQPEMLPMGVLREPGRTGPGSGP